MEDSRRPSLNVARAIRRAGELLKQIEPQAGKRTDIEPSAATDTRLTRTEVAAQATEGQNVPQSTAQHTAIAAPSQRSAQVEGVSIDTASEVKLKSKDQNDPSLGATTAENIASEHGVSAPTFIFDPPFTIAILKSLYIRHTHSEENT